MNLQPLSVDLTLRYGQKKHLLPSYSLDKHSFMHSMTTGNRGEIRMPENNRHS